VSGGTAVRLTLVAHAPTAAASRLVLGDLGPALPGRLPPLPAAERAGPDPAWCGPEPACLGTAAALGLAGRVVPALAGLDHGRWTGRSLAEVAAEDPAGLAAWTGDPDARPHGGETLAELVARVAAPLDQLAATAAPGRTVWVVAPLVCRAVVVAALAAPASVVLGLDVAHAGTVTLSRSAGRWRLQGLARPSGPGAAGAG